MPKVKAAQPRKSRPKTKAILPESAAEDTTGSPPPTIPFPVVAIGASAGGLAAFTELLAELPAESGMAFVLVQHLEPKHESALATLLAKTTSISVTEVTHGLEVKPNRIYIIPPNRSMTIRQGRLCLAARHRAAGQQRSIDEFCVALSEEQGNAAIGVVLSGTGSDGTLGLKAIKAAGGVTFAQEPKSAQWPAMALSAITAGAVDFILTPKLIATELARIGTHPYLGGARDVPEGSDLDKICQILRSSVGVDFRLYKQPTVRRRIARRMALEKISTLARYAQTLRNSREEAQALADDIFIHVTSFFRDPDCFSALRKRALAKLRARRAAGEQIRIWAAGCSTGEEVYSIAMLLLEGMREKPDRNAMQIFGTDIQENAVDLARAGIYSEAAVAGVSPARLKRFFVKVDHGFQIRKSVRDLCVFARHDLAADPPFSRLDLISCRNVLIYMGPALQKRVFSLFQYALKPGGFLFLGNSESISEHTDTFTPEDRKFRIFSRKFLLIPFHNLSSAPDKLGDRDGAASTLLAPAAELDFRKEAETILLQQYAPPALVVDADLHIVHFQGDTSPYLAPASGQPSFHLLKMVRPELIVDLRAAIQKARKEGNTVRKEAVHLVHEGRLVPVGLEVRPLKKRSGNGKPDLLVVFQKAAPAERLEDAKTKGGSAARRAAEKSEGLERELTSTREQLQALIADHETAQEEMKTANEEILSSNEELQSTNEELETAKEELQSSNEELITLNDELQHRNSELNMLTQDLTNLLLGVDIPVLVLDSTLRIRRFTPVAGKLLNLIPGDVGRPFSNIASNLDVTDWKELFARVTEQGQLVEREVRDRNNHRYALRVRPYKTADNQTEGVLVVLLDTDVIYEARDVAQRSGDYARAIVETIHEALVVIDAHGRVLSVNRSYCDLFRVPAQVMIGQPFFGEGPGQHTDSRLRDLIRAVILKKSEITAFELEQDFPGIGRRILRLNARQIDASRTVLIAMDDMTGRKFAQRELQKSESTVRALLESTPQSVIATSRDGRIAIANRRTEEMFGYTWEELVGQKLDMLVVEEQRARHQEWHPSDFPHVQSRAGSTGISVEALRKDGTRFPAEIALATIDSSLGKLGVAFVSDVTERRRMEQTAEAHAGEVAALAASLLKAQEEERRRVSRELHDQICQQLASLAIDMGGWADGLSLPTDAEARLKALQGRAVKASEETRHIAYGLHPSVLDDLGLAASLRALCREFANRANIAVEFKTGILPGSIPIEAASCLYRVGQECLQNIIKHSSAKHVTVRLESRKGDLTLAIRDDGIGFTPDSAKGHGGLGLIGMEERIRLVNGTFTVAAKPGRGTVVTARVPLAAAFV